MADDLEFTCLVFPVPAPGSGRLLPVSAADLKASLGIRPMALSESIREVDRPALAILSEDEELLTRVGQLSRRFSLSGSPGGIEPARGPDDGGARPAGLVFGSIVSGPRGGFEKMLEVLAASGDPREFVLARRGEEALEGNPAAGIRWGDRVLAPGRLDRGGRPLIMGILNVTPDSFSDGGRYAEAGAAIARGLEMEAEGAEILDIGGESTRPGAEAVPLEEESRRVLPVIEGLAGRLEIPISIDTVKAEVARRAVAAGASLVNDVSGMTMDPLMADLAASLGVPVVLNHLRGMPRTMQDSPYYGRVVLEVLLELAGRVRRARRAGVAGDRILVDPGIGFGKRLTDNLALLRHLGVFRSLGAPVLVGVSRKSFIGGLTGRAPGDRLHGSLAAEVLAAAAGAEVLRTHEPAATRDAIRVAAGIAGVALNL